MVSCQLQTNIFVACSWYGCPTSTDHDYIKYVLKKCIFFTGGEELKASQVQTMALTQLWCKPRSFSPIFSSPLSFSFFNIVRHSITWIENKECQITRKGFLSKADFNSNTLKSPG